MIEIIKSLIYTNNINTKRDPKGVGALGALFFLFC